jgi:hypothetical protein
MGLAIFVMPGSGASAQDAQRVRMFDDCEVASFNAAIGDGTCVGDGRTTFDDFVGQLQKNGNVPNRAAKGWAFKPGDFHIDADEHINAVNKGGEFHTFTEVEEFGPGCVPELNAGLGLTGPPVVNCDDPALFASFLPQGASLDVEGLDVGEHLFECIIHPWMRAVVEVRED